MKKKFIIILFLLSLFLVSCQPNENNDNGGDELLGDYVLLTDFISKSAEYEIEDTAVDIYYFENEYLPHIEVKDFLYMLDGVYYSEEFLFEEDLANEKLTISYKVEDEEDGEDFLLELVLDYNRDTIYAEDLAFFDYYIKSTATDFGEGLVNLDPIYHEGDTVTYNLYDYDFDLKIEDDKFLMPLVLANLFFNQSNYFDIIYNGEVMYGVDSSNLSNGAHKVMLESKYNEKDIPEALRIHNYNYYCLVIDYFFGLKNDRNIESGKSFIKYDNFMKGDNNRKIYDIVFQLDDLHTSHVGKGYYNYDIYGTLSFKGGLNGPKVSGFYNKVSKVQNSAVDYFGVSGGMIDFPDFEYINGDTLVIYLMEFKVETPPLIEEIIKNANSETKNIVIDLTFNTGGNLGAALRILTLATNEEVWYHSKNPLNNERSSYGVVGEKEGYDSYNYFIKTSGITFSAANLFASMGKELGIPVIGQKSSGGASAISFFVFPDSSMIIMSSNLVLTDKDYNSVEKGIDVDYQLNNLYDVEEIAIAINEFYKWHR